MPVRYYKFVGRAIWITSFGLAGFVPGLLKESERQVIENMKGWGEYPQPLTYSLSLDERVGSGLSSP